MRIREDGLFFVAYGVAAAGSAVEGMSSREVVASFEEVVARCRRSGSRFFRNGSEF